MIADRIRSSARVSISSTVLSAWSSSSTIVIPATAAVGDLAVLFDFALRTTGVPDVIPTGWTGLVTDTNGDNTRIRCSYKKLVSGDPGATITGLTAAGTANKLMLVFRPSFTIVTITPSTWLAEATEGNPASQLVAASSQAPPLVVCGGAAIISGTAAFSTASPAFDAEIASANGDIIVGYKIYNNAPQDHTIDMNDIQQNGLASGYLVVA